MKESHKYFCKIKMGKIFFQEKYRIDFYNGNPDIKKVGNFLKISFGSSAANAEDDLLYGGYLNKRQVKSIVRYFTKLLEKDDAAKERKK
jgi:hypothetical protein